jgi:hypothetical protein
MWCHYREIEASCSTDKKLATLSGPSDKISTAKKKAVLKKNENSSAR